MIPSSEVAVLLLVVIVTSLALGAIAIAPLFRWVRSVWEERVPPEIAADRAAVERIAKAAMNTRDVRMQAREMVKIARELGKVSLLRAQVDKQLEAQPNHPLALRVRKLLERES